MTGTANAQEEILDDLVIANGINGTTGETLTPAMTGQELLGRISGEDPESESREHYEVLKQKTREQDDDLMGVHPSIDAGKLAETGWGVIYAPGITVETKEALSPLIALRRGQAGRLFQAYDYKPGTSSRDFLLDNETSIAGIAVPEEMPYYLLIVGSPAEIPFNFQYELDVDRAVGRIDFATPAEYDNYARSVVAAEAGEVRLPRRASFFGVMNPNDRATRLSTELLIEPLHDTFKERLQADDRPLKWAVSAHLRDKARRAQLERLLGGEPAETPALLFTASHGVGFNQEDNRQVAHQGALLCDDWDGSARRLPEDVYFAGEHIASEAHLHGLIAFFFACYGAGTPMRDEFSRKVTGQPRQIAPGPFLSALPRRMLSHPRGGALAVIGHIERAWTYSFKAEGVERAHRGDFDAVLHQLFEGFPIGHAFEYFNIRHASATVQLAALLEKKRRKIKVNDVEIVRLWTINNDARDYVILGDPAVRLCVPNDEAGKEVPSTITLNDVDMTPYRRGASLAQPAGETESAASAEPADVDALAPADAESLAILPDELKAQIRTSLRTLSRQVADALRNISSLEVLTYLSEDDLATVYENGRFNDKATLKAVTRIALDGDVQSLIPSRTVESLTDDENRLTVTVEVDQALLTIHRDMVELAQANRTTFLKNLAEVAVTLANARL